MAVGYLGSVVGWWEVYWLVGGVLILGGRGEEATLVQVESSSCFHSSLKYPFHCTATRNWVLLHNMNALRAVDRSQGCSAAILLWWVKGKVHIYQPTLEVFTSKLIVWSLWALSGEISE